MSGTFSTGTLVVTNGSKTVRIVGAMSILPNMRPDDAIAIEGDLMNAVASLTSEEYFELARPFDGPSQGDASFMLWHMPAGWGAQAALHEDIAAYLRLLGEGLPFTEAQLAATLSTLTGLKTASESAAVAAAGSAGAAAGSAGAAAGSAGTAATKAGEATTARDAAVPAAATATTKAAEAAAARDASFTNANVYATTAAGLAATTDGQQFHVLSGLDIVRYRRDSSSVATEVARMPSTSGQRTRLARMLGDAGFYSGDVIGAIRAGDWAVVNASGWSLSGKEIAINGTGFSISPRLFGKGHQRSANAPILITAEATFTTLENASRGLVIGFGDTTAGFKGLLINGSGSAGLITDQSVSSEAAPDGMRQIIPGFVAGNRVRLTAAIRANGTGYIIAENITTGTWGIREVSNVPEGSVWVGWNSTSVGTIHYLDVREPAALPDDIDPPDYQREMYPNLIRSGGVAGWTKTGTGATFNEVVVGGQKMLEFVATSGNNATVDYDIKLDTSYAALFMRLVLESMTTPAGGAGEPSIFLLQYTDAGGIGHNAATEVAGTRFTFVLGLVAIVSPQMRGRSIVIDPTARRLVLRVGSNSWGTTLRLSKPIASYDTVDRRYRRSDKITPVEASLTSLGTSLAGQGATIAILSAKVNGLSAAQDRAVVLADVNHVVGGGQSLMAGVSATPGITTAQPFANLMLANGEHDFSADTQGVTATPTSTTLVPLIYSKIGETVGLGGMNMLKSLLTGAGLVGELSWANMARGGTAIAQLSKGSNYYSWGLAQAAAVKTAALAAGKTFVQQAIWWMQGEADASAGNDRAVYKAALKQLINDWNGDLPQTHDVPMLTYQMASHTVRNGGVPPNIAQAQLEASIEHDNIYLVTPMYHVPYQSDNVHLINHSSRWIGQYFAKVHHIVCNLGLHWEPLRPLVFRQQGALIDGIFHVPVGPLVLDTTLVAAVANYGFTAVKDSDGSAVAISSVALRGKDGVRIILAADPGGLVRIRYAWGVAGQGSGPTTGARGNLRDSDASVALYNNAAGQPYPLQNWCVIFEKVCETY